MKVQIVDDVELKTFKTLLKKYEGGRELNYTIRNWGIARGGYDLWFEIYYKGIPVIGCVDGEIEAYNAEFQAYANLVATEYKMKTVA